MAAFRPSRVHWSCRAFTPPCLPFWVVAGGGWLRNLLAHSHGCSCGHQRPGGTLIGRGGHPYLTPQARLAAPPPRECYNLSFTTASLDNRHEVLSGRVMLQNRSVEIGSVQHYVFGRHSKVGLDAKHCSNRRFNGNSQRFSGLRRVASLEISEPAPLNARQPKFLFGTVAVLNRLQHPIAVSITFVPHAGL